jgi:hypothetical protein
MAKSSYDILIARLDEFIRKYYLNQLLRGVLLFAAILGAYFLLASVSEYQMYFPGAVRKAFLAGFIITGLATLSLFIVKPLMGFWRLGRTLTHEQAAKVVGDHFSDIQDKLLNVLQLRSTHQPGVSLELLEAGISQKIEHIRLVPFTDAVDLGENKKYLRYALPPVLMIMALLLFSPEVLRQGTLRLVNPNINFPKQAPFDFSIKTTSLKVVQFEDLEVVMSVSGKALPAQSYVEVGGRQYKMVKNGNAYTHRFTNVQQDFKFQFTANGYYSKQYTVNVVNKPMISDFRIRLSYPAYTGRKAETVSNTGDLFIPEGTTATWLFNASHTRDVKLRFGDQLVDASPKGKKAFEVSRRPSGDMRYSIIYSNAEFPNGDSMSFHIAVTPDRTPAIRVEQLGDSLSPNYQFFIGDIADDYGFSRLEMHSRVIGQNGQARVVKKVPVPFKKGVSITDFTYSFNTAEVSIGPGESLEYYFEVWDNDGVNGAKSARSQVFFVNKPSIEQFEKLEQQNNEAIKDNMSAAQKRMKQIADRIKELRERVVSRQNFTWEDKKAFDDLQKEQQQLQKQMEEMQKKFEENLARQDEFKEVDPEILEKQQKLEELMKDLMSEDMKKLMEEINKLLEDLQQKNALEQLQNMEMSNEKLNQEMDKMLELFKQLEFQQKVYEMAEQLEKLAEEQKQLSEDTREGKESPQELLKQQEELNKKFDQLKDKLDKVQELNKELGNPANLDKPEDMADDVKKDMQNSSDQLEQNQPQKAAPKQKDAGEKMEKMAEDMRGAMSDMMAEQDGEDMETMRQLLENLLELSFNQEKLMEEVRATDPSNPKYVALVQQQFKLRDDMKMIDDSLQSLAKRQFQLEKFITDESYKIRREMKKTISLLEDRNRGAAMSSQQYIMTSANNLALMLSESLQNMQQQMRQSKSKQSGSGQCKNPSDGSPQQKESIKQMQQKLGEQLRQAQDMMKQGKDPRKMSKEFAQMAAQQAAIREALRKMKEGMSQEQKDKGKVDQLMQQMDNFERDLAHKKLTEEMIKRQKDFETRLLELENAMREQDEDEQRKSNTAQEMPPKMPAALEEYLKKRKSELDVYKTIPPALKPFYKNLVERYYKSIN